MYPSRSFYVFNKYLSGARSQKQKQCLEACLWPSFHQNARDNDDETTTTTTTAAAPAPAAAHITTAAPPAPAAAVAAARATKVITAY